YPAAADRPGWPVRDRDDVRHPPGDLVPGVRPTDLPHVADPQSLRAGRLAGVHGDRPVLDHRGALRRGRDRALLRRFHQQGWSGMNGDVDVRGRRVVVIGAAVAGTAAAEVLAL